MKITLDISKLVEEGKLTREEADKLTALAAHDTGSLGINILIGFGVIAIAAGAVALVPTPLTAVGLGLALFAAGCAIVLNRVQQWILLGQICLVIGALMFGGGVIAYGAGSLASMLIVTGAFALAAIAARSSLLMALAVLAASACLGARTGYDNAVYSLAIFEPTLTVVLFSALALIAYQASERLPADYERLAITAARTSLLLINFGFWIGSLWGDPLMLLRSMNAKDASLDRDQDCNPGHGIQHPLGSGLARRRDLGRAGQPALAGQPRRPLRRHSFLHPMVRTPRRHAVVGAARRGGDVGERLRALDV